MITQLTGTLVKADLTTAVLDVNGVGYLISIPMSTFDALPRAGEKTTLLTHMQISENDIALYGFATERERTVFGMLITVSGIGPKTALNILSLFNIVPKTVLLAGSAQLVQLFLDGFQLQSLFQNIEDGLGVIEFNLVFFKLKHYFTTFM